MTLTPAKCEKHRPKPDGKPNKVLDHSRLYLVATLNKGEVRKVWKWRYLRPVTKNENMLTLGVYGGHPGELDLEAARAKRAEFEKMLAAGKDPNPKEGADLGQSQEGVTFQVAAKAWFASEQDGVFRVRTVHRNGSLLNHLTSRLGDKPIAAIVPEDIFAVYHSLKKKVSPDTAQRVCKRASAIFQFGMLPMNKWCAADPAAPVCKWIVGEHRKHGVSRNDREEKRPSIVRDGILPQWLDRLATLVTKLDHYNMRKESGPYVRYALQFLLLTNVRPGMVTDAKWSEFDFAHKVWTIPAARMKMKKAFNMPLSRQALAILEQLRPLTQHDGNPWVFSPETNHIKLKGADGKPVIIECGLSPNTLNKALQIMGYDTQADLCAHGFRAISYSLLQEDELWPAAWPQKAVQLHHAHSKKGVQGRYDESQHMGVRTKMAQAWADFLDTHRKPKLRLVG